MTLRVVSGTSVKYVHVLIISGILRYYRAAKDEFLKTTKQDYQAPNEERSRQPERTSQKPLKLGKWRAYGYNDQDTREDSLRGKVGVPQKDYW